MIITHIAAGMGNQMHLYAVGLALALRHKTELKLGTWECDMYASETRPYQLSCFPAITEQKATFRETWQISPRMGFLTLLSRKPIRRYHIFRRVMRKIARKCLPLGHVYYVQKDGYDAFWSLPDNTYMGWLMGEKYFADIESLVRKKFKFAPDCFNPELTQRIRACNSVALHVRRGDKVNNPSFLPSDEGYLREALEKMSSLTESPTFFVFSDGIDWCRANLPSIYDAEYIFIDGQTPPQDLALMTICRHVIMGPSTFSWWGAWLNENPGKIVIAPGPSLYVPNRSRGTKSESRHKDWIIIE